MKKKLTISIDEHVYNKLHEVIGRGKIAKFIEDRVMPFIDEKTLEESYKHIAADKNAEQEAYEWSENTLNDAEDGSW